MSASREYRAIASKRRTSFEEAANTMFDEDFVGRIVPFDREAARHYAEIAAERDRRGRSISQFDAQIAAIARSTGAILATRNVADFDHCGIKVVNPWD
jgi:predicted nucleic acid-binding protein